MAFKARYSGTCKRCSQAINVGDMIARYSRGSGYEHSMCTKKDPETERFDAEYQKGVADYDRWKFNTMIGGDEYAAAEELAHDMRFGDW